MARSAPPVSPSPAPSALPTSVLCLGDALVDLVAEARLEAPSDATAFLPRLGGASANVAVNAARLGARVALAGAAGEDAWGRWLRDSLAREGVDVTRYLLRAGAETLIALVTTDAGGEPAYRLLADPGESVAEVFPADRPEVLEAAIAEFGALCITSNTLARPADRERTMAARAAALEAGRAVIFDANLRLHRWRSQADAAASANACVPGALVVRCNAAEAAVMTGESDPERAAAALVKAGARLAVVTLGAEGALLRGEHRRDVGGVPVEVRSTIGAGDAFTGVLVARLAGSGFYPAAVPAALDEAVAAAARACERWSAL